MPLIPTALPSALNLLLWLAAYNPAQRNRMFAKLPQGAKQNFIEHDHELMVKQTKEKKHTFPHHQCPTFGDTMDYVRTQLSTDGHSEFIDAIGKGAQLAEAKCSGNSGGEEDLPLFMNPIALDRIPMAFVMYLRLRGFSPQQAIEIFFVFPEEHRHCLREFESGDTWRDVPLHINICLETYDRFVSKEWKTKMKFLTEIMDTDVDQKESGNSD